MSRIHIFFGSVYGGAEQLAEQAEQCLQQQGHDGHICDDPSIDDIQQADAILVVTSTTGEGDIPAELEVFYEQLRERFPLLEQKPFGVICLGDSSYGETYCGAGHKWFELLEELQGKAIKPLLKIDACETLEPDSVALPWLQDWQAAV